MLPGTEEVHVGFLPEDAHYWVTCRECGFKYSYWASSRDQSCPRCPKPKKIGTTSFSDIIEKVRVAIVGMWLIWVVMIWMDTTSGLPLKVLLFVAPLLVLYLIRRW